MYIPKYSKKSKIFFSFYIDIISLFHKLYTLQFKKINNNSFRSIGNRLKNKSIGYDCSQLLETNNLKTILKHFL